MASFFIANELISKEIGNVASTEEDADGFSFIDENAGIVAYLSKPCSFYITSVGEESEQ